MTVINVTKNDVGYDITFTVTDGNGTAVNLLGSSAVFRCGRPGEVPLVSGACTSLSGAGTCIYTVAAGDFDVEGIYDGELTVVSGSQSITATGMEFRVGGEL